MLIEAAKGGHTNVVNLLLDFPTAPNCSNSPTELSQSPDTHLNDVSCYQSFDSVQIKSVLK